MKLQPFGPVHRQDFHRRGLGLGVRRLKSRLEVKVGLDEGGFGEPVIRRGQEVQVGPGVGHSPGAFPGGDPGPGGGLLKEAGQDVGQRPPPYPAPGELKRLGQTRQGGGPVIRSGWGRKTAQFLGPQIPRQLGHPGQGGQGLGAPGTPERRGPGHLVLGPGQGPGQIVQMGHGAALGQLQALPDPDRQPGII